MSKIIRTLAMAVVFAHSLVGGSATAVVPVGGAVELTPFIEHTAVAGNGRGLVVVAWSLGEGLFLQRFQGGRPEGAIQEIDTIGGYPQSVDVAVSPGGNVTISSYEQCCLLGNPPAPPKTSLYHLAPDGTLLQEPQIFSPMGSQFRIDGGVDGGFALLGPETVGQQFELYLHLFDAKGAQVGAPVPVGVSPGRRLSYWDIAMDTAGTSLVVWTEQSCETLPCVYQGLYGRIFDPKGAATTPILPLAEVAIGVSATALPDGRFLVAWNVPEDATFNVQTAMSIDARTVSEQGLGAVLPANEPATGMTNGRAPGSRPLVAADARGNVLISWQERQPPSLGELSWRLLVQGFDPDAGRKGLRSLVSEVSEAWQIGSGSAAGKPGDFLVGWGEIRESSQPVVIQRFQVEADVLPLFP